MRTSSHFLAALTIIAASSYALSAVAVPPTPTTTPPPPPKAPKAKVKCYKENANLSVSFNTMESSAAAAIAYPDAKFKEVEQLLLQAAPNHTLQSMNYNINKQNNNRYGGNGANQQWQISGSFNVQFTSVENARTALMTLDEKDFFPRLNVNKNKIHNCK